MTYQALEMQKFVKEHYRLSPVSEMEFAFEPHGETDQHKRNSSLAFTKRMKALDPVLQEMFDVQHKLFLCFNEMPVVFKLGFNYHAFNALAPLYAKLEKTVKEFQKTLKKHSGQPEVVEYYKELEPFLAVSVYDMMKSDFALFESETVKRMAENKASDPVWDRWDSEFINWEMVNQLYKEAKK